MWARGHNFCSHYWFVLGKALILFKSKLYFIQDFCFLGPWWDTVLMSVSLAYDNLPAIMQLAHSLLQTQPATVCHIMFLGKVNFHMNRHAQLYHLRHVIESSLLNVYHSTALCQLQRLAHCSRFQFLVIPSS